MERGIIYQKEYFSTHILNLIDPLCIVPIHVYMGLLAGPVRVQKYKKFYIFERE